MTRNTLLLTDAELIRTKRKLAAITKRARSKGFETNLEVITHGTQVVANHGDFLRLPLGAQVVLNEVSISGEAPCYSGWRLLAAVDALPHDDDVEWVIRKAIDTEATIDRSMLKNGYCGHCHTNRPTRRAFYVVENVETGERLQVGKSCLADFVGHSITPIFITERDIVDDGLRLERDFDAFAPEYIVTLAMAAHRAFGWQPSRSLGTSNAERIRHYLRDSEERAEMDAVMPSPPEVADLLTMVRESLQERPSDFGENLLSVMNADSLTDRQIPLLAAIVTVSRAAKKEPEESQPIISAWQGTQGERLEITGTVVVRRMIDGFGYGTRSLLLVIDNGVGQIKVITTAKWVMDTPHSVGDVFSCVGIVKKHDVYNDVKQTVLTRIKPLPKED